MSATPRPWYKLYEGSGDYLIIGADENEVASVSRPDAHLMGIGKGADINEANANLIVTAVNHFEAMKEKLAFLLDRFENHNQQWNELDRLAAMKARAVLAAIEEK